MFKRNRLRSGGLDPRITDKPLPLLKAYVDCFNNGHVAGWAANELDHSEFIRIEVRDSKTLLQVELADRSRIDVNEAGFEGNHGFDFVLHPSIEQYSGELEFFAECRDCRKRIDVGSHYDAIETFFKETEVAGDLPRCVTFWGSQNLIANPNIVEYHNAVYIPIKPNFFIDEDRTWGLYTEDGQLIKEGGYYRGDPMHTVGQSPELDLKAFEIVEVPYETMIYGGPVIAHYGHFLLTTFSRCWALDGTYPILFHSSPPFKDHRAPHITTLFSAAGITPSNSVSFERPTRIKKILVPQPALIEQNSVSQLYATTMAGIGRQVLGTTTLGLKRKIYLSKSKLTFGVARLGGEKFLENKLANAGFSIVHPEELSLSEQVSVFREASCIVGTAGSAFHTLALAPQASCNRIVLCATNFINSNFALLDNISRGSTSYISLADHVNHLNEPGFNDSHVLKNARLLADKVIALVDDLYGEIAD